jgi:hypothetical protein
MYTNTCEDTIDAPQHDKTTRANDTGNLWVPSLMAYHQSLRGASIVSSHVFTVLAKKGQFASYKEKLEK